MSRSTSTSVAACTPLSPLFGCTLDEFVEVHALWSPARLWASVVVYYALVIAPVVVMASEMPVLRSLAAARSLSQTSPTNALPARRHEPLCLLPAERARIRGDR